MYELQTEISSLRLQPVREIFLQSGIQNLFFYLVFS